MTTFTPIPGPIVKAVCAVQATLEAVKKSQNNQHGGYKFASTDDIYAAVTQKMGQVGLVCLPLEEEAKIERHQNKDGKDVPWLRVVYNFVLATEEASWLDERNRRTLLIQITGPQTFQAALSYCEKSYLRALFKIPTGDMDLDALPDSYEYNPIKFGSREPNATLTPPPPPPVVVERVADAETPDKFDAAAFIVHLDTRLSKAMSEDDLDSEWQQSEEAMDGHLSRTEREHAASIYAKHSFRIKATGEQK